MCKIAEQEFYKTLGQNIKRRREEVGLTEKELADFAGISVRVLKTVEEGRKTTRFTASHWRRVCEALQVSADSLVEKR